jgi:hypothetical protein
MPIQDKKDSDAHTNKNINAKRIYTSHAWPYHLSLNPSIKIFISIFKEMSMIYGLIYLEFN